MYKFNIEESFKKGWELTKKHWAVVLCSFIILILISIAFGILQGIFTGYSQSSYERESISAFNSGVGFLISVVSMVVSLWTGFNFYKMTLDIADNEPPRSKLYTSLHYVEVSSLK